MPASPRWPRSGRTIYSLSGPVSCFSEFPEGSCCPAREERSGAAGGLSGDIRLLLPWRTGESPFAKPTRGLGLFHVFNSPEVSKTQFHGRLH